MKVLACIHQCSCVFLVVLDLDTTAVHFSETFHRGTGDPNGLCIPLDKGIGCFGKFVPPCSSELPSAVRSVVASYQIFLKLMKTQRCSSGSDTEKNPKKPMITALGYLCKTVCGRAQIWRREEVKVSHSNQRRRLRKSRKGEDSLSTTSPTLITDQREESSM